jgi:hypothetical protein
LKALLNFQIITKFGDSFKILPINYPFLRAMMAHWYRADLWAGCLGVRAPPGAGKFSFHHSFQTGFWAQAASYSIGTRALSLEENWPEREVDHSFPSSENVKNVRSYTATIHSPTTPSLRAAPLKYGDNFTFTLPYRIHKIIIYTISILLVTVSHNINRWNVFFCGNKM